MQKLAKIASLTLFTVLFMCILSVDCDAQKVKKKRKKKKRKGKVEKVDTKPTPPATPTKPTKTDTTGKSIDTSEADALLKEDKDKWGTDSLETIKNYSLYREFYKQKGYDDAIGYWRYVYKNAPSARKTPLLDGEKMYKHYLDAEITGAICKDGEAENKKACKEKGGFVKHKFKSDATAKALFDTINNIYETRVKHFGEEGYVTTKKAKLLYKYYPEQKDVIFALRKEAIDKEAEDADYVIVYQYFRNLLQKAKAKEIALDTLVEKYDALAEVMDYNINNNEDEKRVEKYQKYFDKMETTMNKILEKREAIAVAKADAKAAATEKAKLANATDCPTIKQVYGDKYRANPTDLTTIKILYKRLKKGGCKSDPLFMEALLKWQSLDPSASRARYIAQTYQKQSNISAATDYYKKSLDLESDPTKQAKVYMKLARIEQVGNNNYSAARNYAKKAAQLQAGWGDPYIFIGDLYLRSKSSISDGLGGSSVYWVAYDMYAKAKEIDPTLGSKAKQKMSNARKGFPNKETLFMSKGLSPGARFTVGGWIGQSTRVK